MISMSRLDLEKCSTVPEWNPISSRFNIVKVSGPNMGREYNRVCLNDDCETSTVVSSEGFANGVHYTEIELASLNFDIKMGIVSIDGDVINDPIRLNDEFNRNCIGIHCKSDPSLRDSRRIKSALQSSLLKVLDDRAVGKLADGPLDPCVFFSDGRCSGKLANGAPCPNPHFRSHVRSLTSDGSKGARITLGGIVAESSRFGLLLDLDNLELTLRYFSPNNHSDVPNRVTKLASLTEGKTYYFACLFRNTHKSAVVLAVPDKQKEVYGTVINRLINHIVELRRRLHEMEVNASQNEHTYNQLKRDYEELHAALVG